jgi:hypothetical protein
MNLAPSTLPRCGTRVKVVRPLRWLHSLVTARMPMIGRITVIGAPIAAAKLSNVSSVVGGEDDERRRRQHAHDDDARHQPEAGAGVEHLAQFHAR